MSYATYLGITSQLEGGGSFNLEPGPDPSRGHITVSSKAWEDVKIDHSRGHTLKFFDYNKTPYEFLHIFVESVDAAGPGLVTVGLVDARILWKDRTYTGILNTTYDDGQTYNSETINGTKAWKFSEVIDKYVEAITDNPTGSYKPKVNISKDVKSVDTTGDPMLKNVNWEFAPAAECIQGALNIVGGIISIDRKGDIQISIPGDDYASSKVPQNKINQTGGGKQKNNPSKPQYLKLKYKILREKKFTNTHWEAVMPYPHRKKDGGEISEDDGRPGEWGAVKDVLDAMGTSKKIVDLHYHTLEDQFGVSKDGKGSDAQKHKLAAVNHIKGHLYKFFRLKTPTTTSDDSREHILPLHATTASFSRDDDDESHFAAAWADKTTGIVCNDNGGYDTGFVDPLCVRIVDQNQGIIQFQRQLPTCEDNQLGDDETKHGHALGKTDITVVVAYFKKFVSSSGLQEDYYTPGPTRGYKDSWAKDVDGNKETANILVEDTYYVEQDLGSGFSEQNETAIDSFSAIYAEKFFKSFSTESAPVEYTLGKFDESFDKLDSSLQYISLDVNGQSGGTQRLRFHDKEPINPYSRRILEQIPATQGVGRTVRLGDMSIMLSGAMGKSFSLEELKFVGLMSHCADYGKRGASVDFRRAQDFIYPESYGLMASEDQPFSRGSRRKDFRPKGCRIYSDAQERPRIEKIAKIDDVFNHEREMWESRNISAWQYTKPGKKKGGNKSNTKTTPSAGSPSKGADSPPPSGGSGATSGPGSHGGTGGSSALTKSTPGPSSKITPAGAKSKPKKPKEGSTRVFQESSEIDKVPFGYMHQVWLVDEGQKTGKDPDGNPTCRLCIDKRLAHHYSFGKKVLTGPLIDEGEMKQPQGGGSKVHAGQIFDPYQKGWVYYALSGGSTTPPIGTPTPVPTPNPTPVPTPEPVPPGVPGPGPGPVTPGGQPNPPVFPPDTPGLEPVPPGWGPAGGVSPPSGPPQAGPGAVQGFPLFPGGPMRGQGGAPGGVGGGGALPGGGGVEAPTPGAVKGAPTSEWEKKWKKFNADQFDYFSRPAMDFLPNGIDGSEVPSGTYNNSYDRSELTARGGADIGGYGVSQTLRKEYRDFSSRGDYRGGYRFNASMGWDDQEWTPGGSYVQSPYIPGTAFGADVQYPYERPSPYLPGTAPLSKADEERLDVDAQPSTHDWTDYDDERTTTTGWRLQPTTADSLVGILNSVNSVSGRVEALDARSRAEYDATYDDSMGAAATTTTHTTAIPYSAEPGVQVTSATVGWTPAFSCHTFSQNADNTWDFTIESSVAGPGEMKVDIKGDVATSTDLD